MYASVEADYVKLMTSWGNIKLNKGFLEQLAISVAVVVLTVMLWRCTARLNSNLEKKKTVPEEALEDDEEEEIEESQDNDEKSSVPDEKSVKKGEHSYFYTHQHQKTNNDKAMVSSYGWSDSKKSVSIYLTDNVVRNMKDEQLCLNWTITSLSIDLFEASGDDPVKSLEISHLFQEITDVTWTASKDTLTIVLTKAEEKPWTSLNGAARKLEDHIQYDDAFYD